MAPRGNTKNTMRAQALVAALAERGVEMTQARAAQLISVKAKVIAQAMGMSVSHYLDKYFNVERFADSIAAEGDELSTDELVARMSPELKARMEQYLADERVRRAGQPMPRHTEMPNPPYPAEDNPMLEYLIEASRAQRHHGGVREDGELIWLAVHAWFEGQIEGFDRGWREAMKAQRSAPEADNN